MTAPTTHWSTTGRLHTGTVAGCEACGKVPTRPATAPRSDAGPESVSLSHRDDDNGPEVGSTNADFNAATPVIQIHFDPAPPPRPQGPCPVAVQHRWAWLTNGRQACGYCGKPR